MTRTGARTVRRAREASICVSQPYRKPVDLRLKSSVKLEKNGAKLRKTLEPRQWHCEGQGFDPPRLHHPPPRWVSATPQSAPWVSRDGCTRVLIAHRRL